LLRPLVLVLATALAGCSDWPDLGVGEDPSAEYPALVPFDEIETLARLTEEEKEDAREIEADLFQRAEILKRRAEILDMPVDDREALEELADRLKAETDG
jgi:hypothetical protein